MNVYLNYQIVLEVIKETDFIVKKDILVHFVKCVIIKVLYEMKNMVRHQKIIVKYVLKE